MDILTGLIRHALGAGAAALASKGFIDADTATQLVGAAGVIAAIIWSVGSKLLGRKAS